ncbi:uncharacterized protein PV07_06731 [Cladophialophora immunda]|uniref:Uncharacterized protein n=1 Tax=Cladophialophora immunda TaxID=569365 RepID=A0A0D2CTK9_9EURO|nr:uncharacterized protein PV07_06731 [Cladophialophora immunda]KIW26944.1 hypothetical protein PV07_06731 [Cladophialophora immunda]
MIGIAGLHKGRLLDTFSLSVPMEIEVVQSSDRTTVFNSSHHTTSTSQPTPPPLRLGPWANEGPCGLDPKADKSPREPELPSYRCVLLCQLHRRNSRCPYAGLCSHGQAYAENLRKVLRTPKMRGMAILAVVDQLLQAVHGPRPLMFAHVHKDDAPAMPSTWRWCRAFQEVAHLGSLGLGARLLSST